MINRMTPEKAARIRKSVAVLLYFVMHSVIWEDPRRGSRPLEVTAENLAKANCKLTQLYQIVGD